MVIKIVSRLHFATTSAVSHCLAVLAAILICGCRQSEPPTPPLSRRSIYIDARDAVTIAKETVNQVAIIPTHDILWPMNVDWSTSEDRALGTQDRLTVKFTTPSMPIGYPPSPDGVAKVYFHAVGIGDVGSTFNVQIDETSGEIRFYPGSVPDGNIANSVFATARMLDSRHMHVQGTFKLPSVVVTADSVLAKRVN